MIYWLLFGKNQLKFQNDQFYVEVKDKRYLIHPTENIILRRTHPPLSLETQNQVQNDHQIRKNQKVIRDDNDQLVVKNYPKKKQSSQQQLTFKPTVCPSCKQIIWLDFDKGFYCQNCEYIMNKQKHQIDKKVCRQNHYFSNRLPYASKKIRENRINLVNTTYIR